MGDLSVPFPALLWFHDAAGTPPVNFDFFTWNLQWQPFYATFTPAALPPAAQERLNNHGYLQPGGAEGKTIMVTFSPEALKVTLVEQIRSRGVRLPGSVWRAV